MGSDGDLASRLGLAELHIIYHRYRSLSFGGGGGVGGPGRGG